MITKKEIFPIVKPALLAQLEIIYQDNSKKIIKTDKSWSVANNGPIIHSGIYDGEEYDANKQLSNWKTVVVENINKMPKLSPVQHSPIRATQEITPINLRKTSDNKVIFDLGQNMTGIAKINIPVRKNQKITIRFAEMLNKDGSLYTANYRSAKSTDYYVANKNGIITWQPSFTFHGFRYVELSGMSSEFTPKKDWVTAIVLHSDLKRTGDFESSNKKLNQLQSNIVWGQRSNFVGIPTDCPQRDERLGWTGDAQVFCPTSMFNYNGLDFWSSWLGSMRLDQRKNGAIPSIIPSTKALPISPGWGDAATMIPWALYIRTGDKKVLAKNYEMMKGLVRWYGSTINNNGLVKNMSGFADWLQPYARSQTGDTNKNYIALAFYAHSTQITANTAKTLNFDSDAIKYQKLADQLKNKIQTYYFDKNGKIKSGKESQTAYLLAIAFNLISKDMQKKSGKHLVRLVNDAGGHLRTGFLGTPYIVPILDELGYTKLAYGVLLKETYPSWFYSINQGATTVWERWNSYSHKDGFGNVAMNSFNHYAYGAIGQWMYERIVGITPDEKNPGYKHFFIKPAVNGPLTWAKGSLITSYGQIVVFWEKKANKLNIKITVPPNSTATLILPYGIKNKELVAGEYFFSENIDK